MPTVSQAIKTFLSRVPHNCPEMSAWFSDSMEVQILAAADNGELVEGKRNTWSDGLLEWGNIRLPRNADTEPVSNDYEMRWPLHEHVDYIGMTGWDWKNRRSIRVGYDFDAITNHAAGVGISDDELARVKVAVEKIPQAWLFNSTGGSGLHLYLMFDPENAPETQNHHEHAALARACLGHLSYLVNFNFEASLDVCGGNMWIWGRKMTPDNNGLSLIKRGEGYFEPPIYWRDHIDVITRKRSKVQTQGVSEGEETDVEDMAASRRQVPLDATHRRIINELQSLNFTTYWVADHHLLQTHTCALLKVSKNFAEQGNPLQGHFSTISEQSSDDPGKVNCFCFPCPNGAFKVVRFGNKTPEDKSWCQDSKGWTYCYFNRKLDLVLASAAFGGEEAVGGGFFFPEARDALDVIKSLGESFSVPAELVGKPTVLKKHKDGRVIVEIKCKSDEVGEKVPGFIYQRGKFTKILKVQASSYESEEEQQKFDLNMLDQTIRALLTVNLDEAGWALYDSEKNQWPTHSKDNVRSALKAKSYDTESVEQMLGHSILKSWTLVNIPFERELPGNRQWNKDAAQLRFLPAEVNDDIIIHHPHWDRILQHCGDDLTSTIKEWDWARKSGISSGKDYLLYWIASLIRYPFDPLPYLFLFGPQNSGKSIFHEAISLLIKNQMGVLPADQALTNGGGFNGELANAILCVVEETDLSKSGSVAYNRIKEWVTAIMIAIHPKRIQVYKQKNTTHWIQCSNTRNYCPVFPGDTRITMSYVGELEEEIPKHKLLKLLEDEASYFMATLMSLKLPEPESRLRIPVVMTSNKALAEDSNRDPLSAFLNDYYKPAKGCYILFEAFINSFLDTLSGYDRAQWNKQRVMQEIPACFPVGHHTANKICVGNIALIDQAVEENKLHFILKDQKLVLIE